MTEVQRWEVVGGTSSGGLLVRSGQELRSAELGRLATGSVVRQLELQGDRMRYEKMTGGGPAAGWVSIRLKDKDLLVKVRASSSSAETQQTSPFTPALSVQQPQQTPFSQPSLAGADVAPDTGDTKVKAVSMDGKYVFAYVGDLKHPHDVLALIDLFQGETTNEELFGNRARFVLAGGTREKSTSVEVQKEVVIDVAGLEKGDYELASFAHDDLTRQLNKHLTNENCVVMFGGKALKITAQHGP